MESRLQEPRLDPVVTFCRAPQYSRAPIQDDCCRDRDDRPEIETVRECLSDRIPSGGVEDGPQSAGMVPRVRSTLKVEGMLV